jgi:sec-independent protein translocase protein TatC
MKGTGQSENKLSDSMTFSDHLEELRQRILKSIFSILISDDVM